MPLHSSLGNREKPSVFKNKKSKKSARHGGSCL
uniref:Macaca fascicularis brain cDNA clone: QflA-23221, similar to human similar to 60S ribosomal protein L23a (LOC388574), mRNA, RefSeq: XM_371204.2 n=1 Tax=Macaca fascicularis TaxID=9541 RepID=I7G7N2_MACFA|nr:unnamed protein product [Macaca fascicularis]